VNEDLSFLHRKTTGLYLAPPGSKNLSFITKNKYMYLEMNKGELESYLDSKNGFVDMRKYQKKLKKVIIDDYNIGVMEYDKDIFYLPGGQNSRMFTFDYNIINSDHRFNDSLYWFSGKSKDIGQESKTVNNADIWSNDEYSLFYSGFATGDVKIKKIKKVKKSSELGRNKLQFADGIEAKTDLDMVKIIKSGTNGSFLVVGRAPMVQYFSMYGIDKISVKS
jgi:hypothetical protein